MTDLSRLLAEGSAHAWLFVPSAILLGALHGLEPGHSKTMMAAFIIAVRGTVLQAVLLGLSAAVSHTAVVWVVALAGLYFGRELSGERSEAWLQLASAGIIVGIAAWMTWRTWRGQHAEHDHHHHHDSAARSIALAGRKLELRIFETGVPPRWQIRVAGSTWSPGSLALKTIRADGTEQRFSFVDRGSHFESIEKIPEPHAFRVRVALGGETAEIAFEEHGHDHPHLDPGEADDAHARAHAADIRRRFTGRTVTTPQIVLFGLTGGLIPCPAAITVLLLCIQLKQFSLGFVLVLCFGIGLAVTMVSAGVVAALGMRQIERRWNGLSRFAHHAPYVSAVLIALVGLYTGWLGLHVLVT